MTRYCTGDKIALHCNAMSAMSAMQCSAITLFTGGDVITYYNFLTYGPQKIYLKDRHVNVCGSSTVKLQLYKSMKEGRIRLDTS